MAFKDFVFINVKFNEAQKKALKAALAADFELDLLFREVIEGDYKVSVSLDPKNDTYIAALTVKPEKHKNANKALTYRHSSAVKSLIGVLYYAQYLAGEVWRENEEIIDDF